MGWAGTGALIIAISKLFEGLGSWAAGAGVDLASPAPSTGGELVPVRQDYFEPSRSCSIVNFSINYHVSISFSQATQTTGCSDLRAGFVGTRSITAAAASIGLRSGPVPAPWAAASRGTPACPVLLRDSASLRIARANCSALGFLLTCCR